MHTFTVYDASMLYGNITEDKSADLQISAMFAHVRARQHGKMIVNHECKA